MTVKNGRKLACDQIEVVCFGVDIIAKRNVVHEPEVLLNGWKFKVRINIKSLSVI